MPRMEVNKARETCSIYIAKLYRAIPHCYVFYVHYYNGEVVMQWHANNTDRENK